MQKEKVVLLVFGSGGHKEQMRRLYTKLSDEMAFQNKNYRFITISELGYPLNDELENYEMIPLRDKHSYFQTFLNIPKFVGRFFSILRTLSKNYEIKALVSTGPGIVIPLSWYFKRKGIKIIFIETWSRFETQSLTGKWMYKLADTFYIQNESLKRIYPNAIWGGLL